MPVSQLDPDGPAIAEVDAPDADPDDFEYDEMTPTWNFCAKDDEGAIPIWVCAERGMEPPRRVPS